MSQIVLNIENQELEDTLKRYAKQHKKKIEQVAIDAIKQFAEFINNNKIEYKQRDVTKHMHVIKKELDDENLDDVVPYSYIQDSAEHIRELRRKRNN